MSAGFCLLEHTNTLDKSNLVDLLKTAKLTNFNGTYYKAGSDL